MRTRRVVLFASLVIGVALLAWAVWLATRPPGITTAPPSYYPETREEIKSWLRPALGRSVRTAVADLGLDQAERIWVDEPPCILRGACYRLPGERSVTLYLAANEPLYRQFKEERNWDYNAFLDCCVGGIQYHVGQKTFDLGPMVPFQFGGERLDDTTEK